MDVSRKAKDALLRLAGQFPVIGITGPRQSGKSTLAKMTFPDKKYVTLDDKDLRAFVASNPKDFLEAFPDGVIIDEAQKVPEIFDAVKLLVDSKKHAPGKYILTGSNQYRLKENMTDSLAGRATFLRLLPFSLGELKESNLLPQNPYDLVFKGFYPPLYDSEKRFIPEDWFESYIDTYLDLDVKEHITAANISTFRKFIQICALYSGQLLSMESISKNLGVSAPTVKQWLSILESSFIIHFLEADTNNLGRTIVKTPKMYFTDTGLLCHLLRLESKEELLLSPYKGAVVETFAVDELLKSRYNIAKKPELTFFRDAKGFEVDTIADWKRTYAIEIKSNSDTEQKLSANTRKYVSLRSDKKCQGAVFYLGDITCTINGIKYVSWHDWDSLI